jgi:hypothetical protein
MRRIKTFAIFESEKYDRWDLENVEDELNSKVKELGMNFMYGNGALRSYNSPLKTGDLLNNDSIARRRVECQFRSLILPIFFGVSHDDERSCSIKFFGNSGGGKPWENLLDWISIRNTDAETYSVDGHHIGIPPPPGGSTRESGNAHNLNFIIKGIKEMLGNVRGMRCIDTSSHKREEETEFPEIIPSLLPALASLCLGEPEGLKEICDAIKEAGNHQGGLIRRIREMKPDLWKQLAPMIGTGAKETEELSDLGF